ncbi:MAG: hypothetical protein ACRDFZ_00180 [Candidatus Limnocylindria bacterium]
MAASVTRTVSLTPTPEVRSQPATHELSRLVTALFLIIPLAGAILEMGRPSLLLTLGGVAALHLAGEIFLERVGRPIPGDRSLQLILLTWVAGLAVLGAGGWTMPVLDYHSELVVVVGVVAGCYIGLGTPLPVALLWGVAATAAVAMGASLIGPFTAEVGVAAASVAAGTSSGAIVREILQRSTYRRRRTVGLSSGAGEQG